MTLNNPNISIYFRIGVFFIVWIGLVLPCTVKGQNTSQRETGVPAPVILISGLGGTILSENPKLKPCTGSNIIKNAKLYKKEFFEAGFPKNVLFGNPANLAFDESGRPRTDTLSNKLKPVGFARLPGLIKDICDLSLYLQSRNYKRDVNLFEFYYDFRYSVGYNAGELKTFIEGIKTKFGYPKFNIIAHSMGGLIAKQYLSGKGSADLIDKLILVATPNLGTPWALIAVRYGVKGIVSIPFSDGCKLKKAAHNVPGLFNLLPGRRYFSAGRGYLIDGEKGLLDFDQTLSFLKERPETRCLQNENSPPEKLSATLLKEEFHDFSEVRDSWVKPPGVHLYVLAGFGQETLETIEERGRKIKLSWTPEGDKIVPLWSAVSVDADKIFYIDLKIINSDHISMIGNREVKQGILSLLQNGTIDIEKMKGFSLTHPKQINPNRK